MQHVLNLLDLLAIVLGCELRRHFFGAAYTVLRLKEGKKVLIGVLSMSGHCLDLVFIGLWAGDCACAKQVAKAITCEVPARIGLIVSGPLTLLAFHCRATLAVLC